MLEWVLDTSATRNQDIGVQRVAVGSVEDACRTRIPILWLPRWPFSFNGLIILLIDDIGTVDFMIFVQETDKVIGYY